MARINGTILKCKSCGGSLVFDPSSQNLKCFKCGLTQDFEKQNDVEPKPLDFNKTDDYKNWSKEEKFIKCEECGASIMLTSLQYSAVCPYCGSEYVSQVEALPGLKPDVIIPFKFNEKTASEKFIQGVKHKFFVPNTFKKELPNKKIHSVYIPSFSFNATTHSKYSGKIVTYETEGFDNPHRRERVEYISGKLDKTFKNLSVETSSQISNYELGKLEPFNYDESYKFDINFIRGYSVEHYQKQLDACYDMAKSIMSQRIKSEILGQHFNGEVDVAIDTTYSNESYLYRLLPIYNFEYEYNGKKYVARMNGQTGKIGTGLPISKVKVGLVVGLGLLIIGALATLFYFLG